MQQNLCLWNFYKKAKFTYTLTFIILQHICNNVKLLDMNYIHKPVGTMHKKGVMAP